MPPPSPDSWFWAILWARVTGINYNDTEGEMMRLFHVEPFQAIKNALRRPTTHVDMDDVRDDWPPSDEQDEKVNQPD